MTTAIDTQVLSYAPCKALRPFVARFLIVCFPRGHVDSHLPGTGFVVAFRLDGECVINGKYTAPPLSLTGLWDNARTHAHSRGHRAMLVQFTTNGAAAFLRRPLNELFNTTVSLENLLEKPALLRHLHEQLAEASSHVQRIRLLEHFLIARMVGFNPDPLVAAAVSWIADAQPGARIEKLVRFIGLSQSALERRFRRHVGAAPRQFASLVRLQRVVRLREAGHDFTSIAHAAGYFDQSHFIKDFRRFAGCAPETYFPTGTATGCRERQLGHPDLAALRRVG